MKITECRKLDEYLCYFTVEANGEELNEARRRIAEENSTLSENDVLYEAMNRLFDENWDALLAKLMESTQVTPLDEPKFSLLSLSEEGFTCEVAMPIVPDGVELGEYKGITIKAEPYEVTKKLVEGKLRSMQLGFYTLGEHKKAAAKGDVVIFDCKLSAPGVTFKEPERIDARQTVGGPEALRRISKALEGKRAGDIVKCKVLVPASDIEGGENQVEADCDITVTKVCVKEFESLDDGFARRHSKYETLDELRESLRAELELAEKNNAVKRSLSTAPMEAAKAVKIPPTNEEIRRFYYERYLERLKEMAYPSEFNLDIYAKRMGLTAEEFEKHCMPLMDDQIRTRVTLLKIAEAEGLTPSEHDINEYCEALSKHEKTSVEEVKTSHGIYFITLGAMIKLGGDVVRNNARIEVLPPKAEKEA